MTEFSADDVRLEKWVRGTFFIADSARARANKAALEKHFLAEWNGDIDATMRTIHPDRPWQRIPAFGVEVVGVEAVRAYYLDRFRTWPGPAMKFFDRAAVTDECIYVEGRLEVEPRGGFGGIAVDAVRLSAPAVIVVDFREGLVLGETVHVDAATLTGRSLGVEAGDPGAR